jgi:hypothetical protein
MGMDRSFLSNAEVVAASRGFVCIRLMTYESQEEAEFMKSIYIGKSGQLENTTFAVLSPDGKEKLTRVGRAPFHEYRGSADMAKGMNEIASKYKNSKEALNTDTQVPFTEDLTIGLNVASADGLPLVLVVPENEDSLAGIVKAMLPVVWSDPVAGQFAYAVASGEKSLKVITGIEQGATGVFVVQPDQFGLSGKVLAKLDLKSGAREKLQEVVASYPRKPMDHDAHVQLGIDLGIDWISEIPETDVQSLNAKAKRRGK